MPPTESTLFNTRMLHYNNGKSSNDFGKSKIEKLLSVKTTHKPKEHNNNTSSPTSSVTKNMNCVPSRITSYDTDTNKTTDTDTTDNGDRKSVPAPVPAKRSPCEIRNNMKSEKQRLLTYVNWPNPYMDPKDLAKAGFYSTRFEDTVRCAFCKVEVCRWEEGDNAMSDHQRWSNSCPFIRGLEVGNIPLGPNEKIEIPAVSQDTCGKFGIEIRPNSVPERTEQNIDLNKLGITPIRSPNYPNYSTLEARLRTFKEWPLSIRQKPEELADAGFFYTSKGDQTMCFACGGGLKDWLEADDPWEQHARWFPKCSYVQMVKGCEFVSEVSGRLPAVLTPQQGAELRTEAGASTAETAPAVAARKPAASSASASKREKMDDGRLCKICYTEELGVVFLPCGHIVACVKCAPSLATCAVCRQPFTATVRAFLS